MAAVVVVVVVVVVGFGIGEGKWVFCAVEVWPLVSPLSVSPSETFLSCTKMHTHTHRADRTWALSYLISCRFIMRINDTATDTHTVTDAECICLMLFPP